MHTLYLGTCKDLHASTLGYWIRNQLLGLDGSLHEQLQKVSVMLKKDCLSAGTLCLSKGIFLEVFLATVDPTIYIYIYAEILLR